MNGLLGYVNLQLGPKVGTNMRYKVLSLAFLCYAGAALAGVQDYNSIMSAVRTRNLALLKRMVEVGYDINTTANGQTPLCETVYLRDYQGYEMLLSQGATVHVPCMRTMPSQIVNEFYANQPRLGTYYQGSMAETQIMLPVQTTTETAVVPTAQTTTAVQETSEGGVSISDTVLYTGEVAVGVAALGALAFAGGGGGGGGGGGSGGEDTEPAKVKWDSPFHPTKTDIASYETKEYVAKVSTGVRDEDEQLIFTNSFLSPIHASAAYARGYTGYKVDRDTSGYLVKTGTEAITDKKVNIAILDTGFYIKHSKLKDNLAQSLYGSDGKINKTVSFVYGACKNSSDTNCWREISSSVSANKTAIRIQKGDITRSVFLSEWEKYRYSTTFSMVGYDPYTYDANNPLPATDIEMLLSPANEYGFLLADGPDKFLRWSKYLYQRSATPVGYNIEDLALSWKWYPYDYDNAANPSIGGAVYYCNKAQSLCVVEKSAGNYEFVADATLAQLKTLGLFELNYDSEMQHGNTTAGLAIGKKNDHLFHGVAYNAAWIPMAVDLPTFEILQHIPDAINLGADIINISLGPGGVNTTNNKSLATYLSNELNNGSAGELWRKGYQAAAKNNTILVFAAGNDGNKYESSYYAAAPALKEFSSGTYNLTNLVVAVVSVDANNKISSFSQICGSNKNWCVAAPGELLVSAGEAISETSESYKFGSGTSASAPIVAGALAVIKSAFPHLTNQQVVQILFETATDLGEKGVDKIYGHGLINLDAATQPVGPTKVALNNTASGAAVSTASSKISVPKVSKEIVSKLPETMVVLDKYQRGFSVPTAIFIKTAKHENQLENRFKSLIAGDEHKKVATDRFSMAWSDRHESHRFSEMEYGFVDVQMKLLEGLKFGAFYNANTATNGGTYLGRILNNPFAKMKEAWGMNGSYEFAKDWRIDTMWASGKNAFVDEDDWENMDSNRVNSLQTTLVWNGFKNTTLKLVSGMTDERTSALGLWGTGAFKSGNTRTTFFGAGATWNLSDNFRLEGMYYYGMAHGSKQNALIKLSDMTADSFAFNAVYMPDEKHSYGMALVSPMRIRSGTATLDLPVARDSYEDLMYRAVVQANLKPSAREFDLSSYYTNRLTDVISLQSELGVRFNPDHQAGASPDYRGLISIKIEL